VVCVHIVYCNVYVPPSRVYVISKRFEGKMELTEPWYGSKYNLRKIDPQLIDQWSTASTIEELHLPSPNEFIPTNFEIVPLEDGSPRLPVLIQVRGMVNYLFPFYLIST